MVRSVGSGGTGGDVTARRRCCLAQEIDRRRARDEAASVVRGWTFVIDDLKNAGSSGERCLIGVVDALARNPRLRDAQTRWVRERAVEDDEVRSQAGSQPPAFVELP